MSSRASPWPDRSALFSLVNSNPVIIAIVPHTVTPPCLWAFTSVTAHHIDDRPTTAEDWCRECNPTARARVRLLACRRPTEPLESLRTRLGAESIAIIHRRRGMLLKLCTMWLKGHCRAVAASCGKSSSSGPPMMARRVLTSPHKSLH